MKIQMKKENFIKSIIFVLICIIVLILIYIFILYLKAYNDEKNNFKNEEISMQEEIKESFLLEHKIVPENSHFLSRTYDGEISTSDVCKKIYELVINLIPEIYGLRNKNNFELEQYYLENEISIKGVLQLSNKDEFIDVARKIGKLESLEFIDSRYDFDKYAKDELLTEVDLEIEFEKNKIVFKMYLNNKIIQNENNITFRFVQ